MLATKSPSGRPPGADAPVGQIDDQARAGEPAADLGQGLLRLADEIERRAGGTPKAGTALLPRPAPPSPTIIEGRRPARTDRRLVIALVAFVALVGVAVWVAFDSDGGDTDSPVDRASPADVDAEPDAAIDETEAEADEAEAPAEGEASDSPAASDAAPAADDPRGDDEQAGDEGDPADAPADAVVTGGGLECSPAALEEAIGGVVDGQPVVIAEHACEGEFALASFRPDGTDGALVYVAFFSGEGAWSARYFGRSIDCEAIYADAQGFPATLCAAIS